MHPAQPLYFGPSDRPLFGWLHAPTGTPRPVGLVLCSPFGFEAVCAHRTLRVLAERAAAQGFAALRYDPPGCGNSAGDELAFGAVADAQAGVHDAIAALKRHAGVSRVALLGLRTGATAAWLAALERDDVAALAAIAPVVSGRAWLREIKLLGDAGSIGPATPGLVETAGFPLTDAAAASFAAVDLRTLGRAPAPRVLAVARDDGVANDLAWMDAFAPQAEVVRAAWPGYAALMTDPQRAQVPQALIGGVLEWLASESSATAVEARRAEAPPTRPRALLRTLDGGLAAEVQETPVWMPNGATPLFGVLSRPASPQVSRQTRAVLMVNAGSVHHIGPNRLWVHLARRWAARGVTALRMDLAGLGDSPARPGCEENQFYPPAAVDDLASAVDWLHREAGVSEVHLLGLCGGGYHAFKAAARGLPVASAVAINPLTYFWRGGTQLDVELTESESIRMTRRYVARALDSQTWRRLLRGQLDWPMIGRAVGVRVSSAARHAWHELARRLRMGPREDLAAELARATEHGCQLRFVFAQGEPGLALLWSQGGRAVGRLQSRGRISIDVVPDADHTFTRHASRVRLVGLLDGLLGIEPAAAVAGQAVQTPAAVPAALPAYRTGRVPAACITRGQRVA